VTLPRLQKALCGISTYYIAGYPSYIARLAREIDEQGVQLESYPKVVFVSSETMTPLEAEQITRGFRCPTMVEYASFEFLLMAIQCPDNPNVLHVNSESILLEIVTEEGRPADLGERGRVIITDLHNYVMPFIRYEIGDTAIAGGRCPCGRGLPTLERIEGRTSEYIRTPMGRIITSGLLGHMLFVRRDLMSPIVEYQAIQTDPDKVILRLVPSERFDHNTEPALRSALHELLGREMDVEFDVVKHIQKEPNGKRLVIKSQVQGLMA
jgi:phenylacetate-CoA ligase